jgi:hypothetical protein
MAMRTKAPVENTTTTENVATAAEAAAAPVTAAPVQEQAPAPKPETKEVAVKAAAPAPVAAPGRITMDGLVLADYQDRLPALPYGSLPRLVASNGNFMNSDKQSIGNVITGQIISWNDYLVVGPSDDKAPKELVKYSSNMVDLDDGTGTVTDWVAHLKAENWTAAAAKKYKSIVLTLLSATPPTPFTTELIGEIVQLQLSPTSVAEFVSYQVTTSLKVAKGVIAPGDADMVQITATPTSGGGNNWTKAKFKHAG